MLSLYLVHRVSPVSQNIDSRIKFNSSIQCEFKGPLFGFSCAMSTQTATGIWSVGGERKPSVFCFEVQNINIFITGKIEYNENEITSQKGCRDLKENVLSSSASRSSLKLERTSRDCLVQSHCSKQNLLHMCSRTSTCSQFALGVNTRYWVFYLWGLQSPRNHLWS